MIIGIIGKKRHGKDTIADYLVNTKGFEKYSFANPLKRGCMEMFGFTEDQVFGDAKDDIDLVWGCTPRDVLQIMGTELLQLEIQKHIPAFKKIGRHIWVKRFTQYYQQNSDKNLVIADVRFLHEAKAITDLGGVIWKVERPGMPMGDLHASEVEMESIPYDRLIENNSTLDILYNKVDEFNNINA